LSKTIKFQGDKLVNFIEKKVYSQEFFRLQKNRVFILSFFLEGRAITFSKKKIASAGICIGCFSHSGKIRFLIPVLGNLVLENKENSVILSSKGESKFIFGNHPQKENILKISKSLRKNDGVIFFGPNGIRLGFGEIFRDASFLNLNWKKKILIINQGDIGKYIRNNK